MKKGTAFALYLVLVAMGCKKETTGEFEEYASLSVKMNGQAWGNTGASGGFDYTGNPFFGVGAALSTGGIFRQAFGIGTIKATIGKYVVHPFTKFVNTPVFGDSCHAGFSLIHGDEPEDSYEVLEGSGIDNWVSVTSFNRRDSVAKGQFQVTFVRTTNLSVPAAQGFPDTLRFTDGAYRINLRRKEY